MSCQRTSVTTMNKSLRADYNNCQVVRLLLLTIVWTALFTGAMARPSLESLNLPKANDIVAPPLASENFFTRPNDRAAFHDLKTHHYRPANTNNYLSNWPSLRDLVLTIDYDDYVASAMENNNEIVNQRLLERLLQLVPQDGGDIFEDTRDGNEYNVSRKANDVTENQYTYKEHNTKKNVQYMSPCHFKICNMGRKRNARHFNENY